MSFHLREQGSEPQSRLELFLVPGYMCKVMQHIILYPLRGVT